MFGFSSRPIGRLFLLLALLAAVAVWAQAPPLTTVQDTVYRADGTPAQGTLLISWPAFTTANGQAVASGSTSTILGAGGALSVALVANTNATPVNTLYTVVYQTDDPLDYPQ
jgi:trimeric autotransporter adhesin